MEENYDHPNPVRKGGRVSPSSPTNLDSKKPPVENDTIAAISTPFGESGIGIVRLSGLLAGPVARRLFKPRRGPSDLISHRFRYGEIIDPHSGRPVDEALIVLMKKPKTYTREDILEIHCHGGYLILQKVLELALRQGARMAEPGEFTKRAFLNGRIDLTQAEAVMDLIRAKTQTGLEIANRQLRGLLHREMVSIKERLIDRLALIESHIDFPEEEIDRISLKGLQTELEEVLKKMEEWIGSYEEGRVFREGISCAIIGKTNVGKSSLLNILLKEDRVIVTPVPGTTRDVIEEVLNINGIPLRLMDTAGIRKAVDAIEHEGVRRTKERIGDADLILLVIDGSREIDEDDLTIFQGTEEKKRVVVLNKRDLPQKVSFDEIRDRFQTEPIIPVSALKNEGIDHLRSALYKTIIHKEVKSSPDHLIVVNIRHKQALNRAGDSLSNAIIALKEGRSLEFIAFEIRSALEALGEMVGETTNEEVLNKIFEQFCIGK